MSLITILPEILEAGKQEYEEIKAGEFHLAEETEHCIGGWKNKLIQGDNGAAMKMLLEQDGMAGKINMIYIDPPFFT